jgi:hypothetical protein
VGIGVTRQASPGVGDGQKKFRRRQFP